MKKLILFVALFSWIGFSASAQVRKETQKEHPTETKKMEKASHHWYFKDGKVMEMKNGKETAISAETKVGDVWVRPNGEVVMKDKKVVHLKEGQYVNSEGKIHEKMNSDGMKKKKMEPPKLEEMN